MTLGVSRSPGDLPDVLMWILDRVFQTSQRIHVSELCTRFLHHIKHQVSHQKVGTLNLVIACFEHTWVDFHDIFLLCYFSCFSQRQVFRQSYPGLHPSAFPSS